MSTQLRLLDGANRRTWRLDAHTRRVGRSGVAAARLALERAQVPEPTTGPDRLRRAG
jgi:hypothetical protein